MKVVVNRCFGWFSLSKEAYEFLGIPWDGYGFAYCDGSERTDKDLVACVESLGERANGLFAELEVVEVPDDVEWHIHEHDGNESVRANHRLW